MEDNLSEEEIEEIERRLEVIRKVIERNSDTLIEIVEMQADMKRELIEKTGEEDENWEDKIKNLFDIIASWFPLLERS